MESLTIEFRSVEKGASFKRLSKKDCMRQWKRVCMSNMKEDPREIKARFLFMVKVTMTLALLTKEEVK